MADTAYQVDFLLAGYRNPTTDKVLDGGKVKTFLDGTSTLSALWTDKDKGATAANPVILDSAGKAEVYGDNIYKFEIYDSDDVLLETINGLQYMPAVFELSQDGTPQLGGFLDPNSHYIGMDKGADIASASPLVIGTDGDYFDVTGTTNFAAMTVAINRFFVLQFDGILTMTHSAANLDLPGEANITTAAGDVAIFFSHTANKVQCVSYTKADGTAVVVATPSEGKVVAISSTQTGEVATGTTNTSSTDDTIPQSNEGDQYMSLAFTPTDALNILRIDIVMQLASSSAGSRGLGALFKDAVTDALAAIIEFSPAAANVASMLSFSHVMVAGTASEITFNVRGGFAAGTTTFNGYSEARKLGGVIASSIIITEFTP